MSGNVVSGRGTRESEVIRGGVGFCKGFNGEVRIIELLRNYRIKKESLCVQFYKGRPSSRNTSNKIVKGGILKGTRPNKEYD